MKVLIFALVATFFSANADFSFEGVKSWFGELWDKGANKIQEEMEDFEETDMGQKLVKIGSVTKNIIQSNTSGKITQEVLDAYDKILPIASYISEAMDIKIRSNATQDRIDFQEKLQSEFTELIEKILTKKISTLMNGKAVATLIGTKIKNIEKILEKDEDLISLLRDLKEAHKDFQNALEKLEKDLITKK